VALEFCDSVSVWCVNDNAISSVFSSRSCIAPPALALGSRSQPLQSQSDLELVQKENPLRLKTLTDY